MVVAYHGTIKKFVKQILKDGFQPGTYFTNHFDSALTMGGPYVFGVIFDEEFKYWEWISTEVVTKDNILYLQKLSAKNIYYDPKVQRKISNQDKTSVCSRCNGHGELTYKEDGHHLLPRGCSLNNKREIIICPDCNGHGDLDKINKQDL